MTFDTLPANEPFRLYKLPDGRWLLVVRDGVTFGELDRAYRLYLEGPARDYLHWACWVPDPRVDPEGYRKRAWWDPDEPLIWATIGGLEAADRLIPWDHGADAGHLLAHRIAALYAAQHAAHLTAHLN
jgi:hypothetical protein